MFSTTLSFLAFDLVMVNDDPNLEDYTRLSISHIQRTELKKFSKKLPEISYHYSESTNNYHLEMAFDIFFTELIKDLRAKDDPLASMDIFRQLRI